VVDSHLSPFSREGDEVPMRVLVVDDNEHNRLVMQAILPSLGCTMTSVASGEEAAELARVAAFDLVVMDLHMPGIGGDEAAWRIRNDGPSRSAFIVRWSTDMPARLDLGLYDGELPKPLRCAALEDVVGEARRRMLNRADEGSRFTAARGRPHARR
jgi:CheY-like chemotaxis protein